LNRRTGYLVRDLLTQYRDTLTDYRSLLPYAVLGIIGGVASALVILAFDQCIRLLAASWGVGGGEDFEALPRWLHFTLPVVGAGLLGLAFSLLRPESREVGIVHVLSRMHSHYGALPLRNMLVQFVGGAFALASGQSGGREGPGVHLGGAVNSLLGQRLGLPNNSLRILIACGTAGGIAVAFNTPLAGVIFAMEVVVAEYTVIGFIPVMLAAVSASAISHYLQSGAALFSIRPVALTSLWEVPYIVLLGICCGIAVAVFIRIIRLTGAIAHWPVLLRFLLAGVLTGTLALLVPQVLGMGYDTLENVLLGQVAPLALAVIALGKLLATGVSCGLGMPVGLIGPSLLIGGCIGGLLGGIGLTVMPELASEPVLYVVIGMAAAMGAILNAPLAAILAVVELTQTVSIAMPAMLAIIAANLTNTEVFRQRSAHQTVLRQLHRSTPDDPLNHLLHSTHVSSCMEISVARMPVMADAQALESLRQATPGWCLLERGLEPLYLVRGAALRDWLAENPAADGERDLTEASVRRWTIASVPVQATLRQALDTMRAQTAEAVCVYGRNIGGKRALLGVVTRDTIEQFTLSRL
jgi:H+/Cl- antiporter ClcA